MGVEFWNNEFTLLDLECLAKFYLPQTEPFDLAMSEHQSLDHYLFIDLIGLAFDHADSFFGTGDDQIEV